MAPVVTLELGTRACQHGSCFLDVKGMQGIVNPTVVEEAAPNMTGLTAEFLKVQPGGKLLLVLMSNGCVRIWNTKTKVLQSFCNLHSLLMPREFRHRPQFRGFDSETKGLYCPVTSKWSMLHASPE
jgi:hypothetical protein